MGRARSCQEQKAIGYMVERFFEGWWQPFCLLCNRFIDDYDAHLMSDFASMVNSVRVHAYEEAHDSLPVFFFVTRHWISRKEMKTVYLYIYI